MTNEDLNQPPKEPQTIEHNPAETATPRKAWPLSAKIGVALAAVIGIGTVAAQSAGGFGPRGDMFGGGFHAHHIHKALDKVDASQDQEDKIDAILDRTRAELMPLGGEFRDTRAEVLKLLAAPTVDRAALEKLRTERIATIDAASRKTVSAMADAAEVLTPEQRTKLAAEMRDHIGNR